jgi:hypothetical protein
VSLELPLAVPLSPKVPFLILTRAHPLPWRRPHLPLPAPPPHLINVVIVARSCSDGGNVAAAAMFPCSRSHNQARPEATFYRDADEYRYKMCMRCLDRERKRDRGKEAMARVTNTEYDFMFLQPTHWSSALTFFATHGLCAKSATHTKKIHVTPSSAFASIPSNNTTNDNQ